MDSPEKNRKLIFRWEVSGLIFINLLGPLLHFAFEWSGRSNPLALIAAVNESTWEHLKLAFWPALFFALLERKPLRKHANNFLLGKTVGIYATVIIIPVFFYLYLWLIGHDVFVLDIAIFVLAVTIGQLISYFILLRKEFPEPLAKPAFVLLLMLVLAFLLFSYLPPRMLLFQDPLSGGYGITGN
jgi:hypothetical protein